VLAKSVTDPLLEDTVAVVARLPAPKKLVAPLKAGMLGIEIKMGAEKYLIVIWFSKAELVLVGREN
jgi:hypothetical protein